MTCRCGTFGNTDGIRFCKDEHRYWNNDVELTSISRVMDVWPVPPSWKRDGVNMEVIENARDRGETVDALFSSWVIGALKAIPPDTRQDAVDRFKALMDWWNGKPFGEVMWLQSQMIVYDDELAGTIDLVVRTQAGIAIYDLKNTSSLESTHSLKLGAYAELYPLRPVVAIGDIQVTQARGKPVKIQVHEYELSTALSEWRIVREFWNLSQRKSRKATA